MSTILRTAMLAAALIAFVGVIGTQAAAPASTPLTNAKDFFWANGTTQAASASASL